MIKIMYNNSCSKCRTCKAFLEEKNEELEVVKYLEDVPTADELREIIKKLGIKPLELVRQKESIWIEKFRGKNLTDEQIILAMAEYPSLIERPILIKGDKAIIGRDLEKVSEFL